MSEYVAIELAEYIERGLEWPAGRFRGGVRVVESRRCFLQLFDHAYHAGALGLAFIGKLGDPQGALHAWRRVCNSPAAEKFAAAAGLLGISVALARLVEMNHRNGVPAAEVARGLRAGSLTMSFRTLEATAETEKDEVEENYLARSIPSFFSSSA